MNPLFLLEPLRIYIIRGIFTQRRGVPYPFLAVSAAITSCALIHPLTGQLYALDLIMKSGVGEWGCGNEGRSGCLSVGKYFNFLFSLLPHFSRSNTLPLHTKSNINFGSGPLTAKLNLIRIQCWLSLNKVATPSVRLLSVIYSKPYSFQNSLDSGPPKKIIF